MPDQTNATTGFYALLIACDFYFPNRLPNGSKFLSLSGAVRDITRVEQEILIARLKVPKENILKLSSTNDGNKEPVEAPEQRPTYDNIVKSFEKITDMAKEGDQVYIHYSGHGGRIKTTFTEIKDATDFDETLVPIDIGDVSTRYVRDIDLAFILQRMVKKGLKVTLVLDSCHSGGATRGGASDVAVRTAVGGTDSVDTTVRPLDSKVASDAELIENWKSIKKPKTRSVGLIDGWLPEPQGYVLLAACRPSESAIEYNFNDAGRSGVLTYWLLDVCKQLGPHLTWKLVHDRIKGRINSQFSSQTPMLLGETDWVVFGVETIPPQYTIDVLDVDSKTERILLNAGQVFGVPQGAELAVYPSGTTDFTETANRLAMVRIVETGATSSWAEITEELKQSPIEPGAQAVLVDTVTMRRRVRFLLDEPHLADEQRAALRAVQSIIAQKGKGFVEEAPDGDAADYQVSVSQEGDEFEILDPEGKKFPHLRPTLKATTENAEKIVQRLVHLSKYHLVQQIHNFDSLSRLSGKLLVELFKAPKNYRRGDKPDPQAFDSPGNAPVVEVGEMLFLHIKNNSSQVLNVAALDLQPDWAIVQFYPPPDRGDFMPIDGGKEVWEPLQAGLPKGYTEGTDILKVFATVGPANFRWLELPALGEAQRSSATRGLRASPRNALEQLLSNVNSETATTRDVKPSIEASDEWIEAEIMVQVRGQ